MNMEMIDKYKKLKKQHPDLMLLFRFGDFYTTLCEDAEEASRLLGITLCKDRVCYTAMFPVDKLCVFMPKLIIEGKHVAFCDGDYSKTNEKLPKKHTDMKNKMKAADLIGKIITVTGGNVKYVIKSVDGDKLMTDFYMGDRPAMPCPIPVSQAESMIDAGKWVVDGSASSECNESADDNQHEEVNHDDRKGKKVTIKRKTTIKRKQKEAEQDAQEPVSSNRYIYEAYTTRRGKTGAKIMGFSETDVVYQEGAEIHGAKVWERDANGGRRFCLLFSHRYADAAKEVCNALNAGKSLADCKTIIDACTDERAKMREEWRSKREEWLSNRENNNSDGAKEKAQCNVYTEEEVRKTFAALAAASGMDVKDFEPIINAMKKSA